MIINDIEIAWKNTMLCLHRTLFCFTFIRYFNISVNVTVMFKKVYKIVFKRYRHLRCTNVLSGKKGIISSYPHLFHHHLPHFLISLSISLTNNWTKTLQVQSVYDLCLFVMQIYIYIKRNCRFIFIGIDQFGLSIFILEIISVPE